ncbi:MAG: glucosamine-6-phosphate deaminase [Planctomycetota bacterium]|nr:glucosamine-6-phosphate deaminase [Planctomycetota bacterium]
MADVILARLKARSPTSCSGGHRLDTDRRLPRLREARTRAAVSFARVLRSTSDEYLDLPADHPQSYRTFMREHLFQGLDLPPENVHFPPADGKDLLRRCEEYRPASSSAAGSTCSCWGSGALGIGFNEPTSSLASRTRVKTLTERTLEDNARFYGPGERPPVLAVTMGIGTILDARELLLQAIGPKKAQAVRSMVEGPVSSFFPASALQLHRRVTAYLDPEAASLLTMIAYYRRTRAQDEELRRAGRL